MSEYPSLLAYLAVIPDPRQPRGIRHRLVAVLAVAVCAVLTGAKSFQAIGEWATDAPAEVLTALGVRADPWNPPQPPDEATVRRVLTDIDGDALDAAIGALLLALSPPPAPPVPEPPTPRQPSHTARVFVSGEPSLVWRWWFGGVDRVLGCRTARSPWCGRGGSSTGSCGIRRLAAVVA